MKPSFFTNRLLGSGAIVTAGLSVELGSQFARTFLLAHMLDATEFGLVASINTLYALVEMSTAIAIDRHLIFAPDGGESRALGAAHALSLLRGAILSIIILILASPTAILIGERQHAGSFAAVAMVPLLRGFAHLGVTQMQRDRIFWPSAIPECIGAVAGFTAALAAAIITPDHNAIIWGLGVQAVCMVTSSHLLAPRASYKISLDSQSIRSALKFCLPLAVNGFALAISFQLDRLVVGAWLGVIALGVYSLTLTLLIQPIALIQRLMTTMIQPHLSSAWHLDPTGRFPKLVRWTAAVSALLGLVFAVVTICLGGPFWHLVFGPKFLVSDTTFVLFGMLLLIRSGRGCLNLIGLAVGNTAELMIANLTGGISILATIAALYIHPVIASAVLGLLVADSLSSGMLLVRLGVLLDKLDRSIIRELAVVSVLPAVLAIWVLAVEPRPLWRFGVTALVGVLAVARAVRLYRNRP